MANYIIAGLGNPEPEYENTRHNVGRIMVRALAKKSGKGVEFDEWKENKKITALTAKGAVGKKTVELVLPNNFMNNSGKSIAPLITSVKKAESLVVVHDDLDLPLGRFKICFDRGSGGHKGVESIIKNIKTTKFIRVKVGISAHTPGGKLKKPAGEEKVIDFIIGKFKPVELEDLKKVSKKVAEALETLVEEGLQKAMNEFN